MSDENKGGDNKGDDKGGVGGPPPAKTKAEWRPRKGAECVAVYVAAGPRLVETSGRIISEPKEKSGVLRADVEVAGPRGAKFTLEGVPMRERDGDAIEGAHFLPPPEPK